MALSKLSRSISGSVAVVTGAASGMGRATAHLFGDEGARVALLDVNNAALEKVHEEMKRRGIRFQSLVCRSLRRAEYKEGFFRDF